MKEKAAFRRQALKVRSRIADREAKSRAIAEYVLKTVCFKQAETVFMYLSYRSEVGTEDLAKAAFQQGKRVAVPKVEGSRMYFYEICSFQDIKAGYKGIPEPVSCERTAVPKAGDLMLVPGAAFDRRGYRMGYGGGFYDRYLSENQAGYQTVGLAFSEQIYGQIPNEAYDVRLDMIITEKGAVRYEDNIDDRR